MTAQIDYLAGTVEVLEAKLREAEAYAEALRAPAAELLALYDWRPELAKREQAHAAQIGFEDGDEAAWRAEGKELKRLLREYGERKKAGWIALRAALDRENEIVHSLDGAGLETKGEIGAQPAESLDRSVAPQRSHAVVPKYDAFQWTGDLAAFEKWFGERCPVDFGGQISVPVHKSAEGKWLGPWLRVWCGSWVIRHEGRSHTVTDAVYKLLTQTIPSQVRRSEPDPLGEALNSGDGSYKP